MGGTQSIQRDPNQRVSKQDWLQAALDLLRTGGIEAVRVERLAKMLNVAKSGFYYHFNDRSDLHDALLEYWVRIDYAPILADESRANASTEERLAAIAEIVDRADLSRYDSAIRQWAQSDQKVRKVWRAEMQKRIGTIRELLRGLGFEGDNLEMRTRLFVGYQVAERELFGDLTRADRDRLRKLRLRMLLAG